MKLYNGPIRIVKPERFYFTFHRVEYDFILAQHWNVGRMFCKAIRDTNWTSGYQRLRSSQRYNFLGERGWEALEKRGLAIRNGLTWKLREMKSARNGNTVRMSLDKIIAIAEGQMTFNDYHMSTEEGSMTKYSRAARVRAGRLGGAAGKGKAFNGPQLKSMSTEGSNEVLKPWEKLGMSRRSWYRKGLNKIGTND